MKPITQLKKYVKIAHVGFIQFENGYNSLDLPSKDRDIYIGNDGSESVYTGKQVHGFIASIFVIYSQEEFIYCFYQQRKVLPLRLNHNNSGGSHYER